MCPLLSLNALTWHLIQRLLQRKAGALTSSQILCLWTLVLCDLDPPVFFSKKDRSRTILKRGCLRLWVLIGSGKARQILAPQSGISPWRRSQVGKGTAPRRMRSLVPLPNLTQRSWRFGHLRSQLESCYLLCYQSLIILNTHFLLIYLNVCIIKFACS